MLDGIGVGTTNSATSVLVTATNDPPAIGGAKSGQSVTDEATIAPFSGVTITEIDFGQTETATITLSNRANGTLSNIGGGTYDSSTGVYSVTGTDARVTDAIEALVFIPTAHQVTPGATVTTTFTIATSDTAGANTSNASTTVSATAVNDPPAIGGTNPASR